MQGLCQRLMICEDVETAAVQQVSEVPDAQESCQKLPVKC
jgi:hypothetical protein